MKQNLPPAKSQASPALVIFAFALFAAACAIQTPQARHATPEVPSSEVQLSLQAPIANRGSLMNINTASPQELEKLPGIGKVTAERIVSHRQQFGSFRRAEHLMMVRGISDRKFRAIRAMIVAD